MGDTMELYFDIGYQSLNKHGEELCGDSIEIIRNENSIVIVLADGLGSGVKASILSTLTSKIIGTMVSMGSRIEAAVETIINTLPVCSERGIAYSTFSILQIFYSGEAYLVEFDNPAMLYFRKKKFLNLQKNETIIRGKVIREAHFEVLTGDTFILVSDGIIHAGVGKTLNLGWQWENLAEYIKDNCMHELSAKSMVKLLLAVCDSLYLNIPGDDATVAVVKIKPVQKVCILAGPPLDKKMDSELVKKFLKEQGKKLVCGGTTAQIVARELKRDISTNFNCYSPDTPPIAKIKGLHLVTEGIVTLRKTLEYTKAYVITSNRKEDFLNLNRGDGASMLTKILIEESTHVHFFIGRATNPFSMNLDGTFNKINLIEEIAYYLKMIGKEITMEYN